MIKSIRILKNRRSEKIKFVCFTLFGFNISSECECHQPFNDEMFLDRIMVANLTIIFKHKKENDNLENYKRISVLSNIRKIMEKIWLRLISFLNGKCVYNDCQFRLKETLKGDEVTESLNNRKNVSEMCELIQGILPHWVFLTGYPYTQGLIVTLKNT